MINFTTANINPVTGIAYGVIQANHLDGDILDMLSISGGICIEEVERLVDFAQKFGFVVDAQTESETAYQFFKRLETDSWQYMQEQCKDSEETQENFDAFCEDSEEFTGWTYYADYQEVQTIYDTDTNTVTVLQSPCTAVVAKCSPCYPNAGDLDTPDAEGIEAYAVPEEWKYQY